MKKELKQLNNRAIEIDILRAVAVLFMILDHTINDISDVLPYLFSDFPTAGFWSKLVSLCSKYWFWEVRTVGHFAICFVFLAVTGICCSFTRSNLVRGAKLSVVALLLTLVTVIVAKIVDNFDFLITFGVLHCIALTLIVIGILEKFIKNEWFYLIVGLIFVAMGIVFEVNSTIDFYGSRNLALIILRQIVGLSYFGGDNFGFFLNGGQIFIGVFLGKKFYKDKKSPFNFQYKNNFLTFIGRNSLLVYLLHQIIIPVILCIILLICGFNLALPI